MRSFTAFGDGTANSTLGKSAAEGKGSRGLDEAAAMRSRSRLRLDRGFCVPLACALIKSTPPWEATLGRARRGGKGSAASMRQHPKANLGISRVCCLDRQGIRVQLAPPMKHLELSIARVAFLVTGLVALNACGPARPERSGYMAGVGGPIQQSTNGHLAPAIPDDISYWDGEAASGSPMIKINRSQQKAFFYKGSVLVGVSKISSGKEDHATPPGKYKIIEKDKDHKSTLYGCFKDKATGQMLNDNVDIRVDKVPPGAIYYAAPMPNFMRFADGIGMHAGYLPGYAASHGCIRMPHQMSEKFFQNVVTGTPVIVE